jgi:aryl-alcohol dehydrogenase-like predicted oxidoreductase
VNQYGQSRKHIFDSVQKSLKRLQLDYIDVLQCSLPFFFFRLLFALLGMVGNRPSLTSLMSDFPFFPPQAIGLIMIPPSRKWYVHDGASNCGSVAVIAHNTLPLPSSPPLGQMQALHDVVQKGWVHYIGMSSCWAYQCMRPSSAHHPALIRPPLRN